MLLCSGLLACLAHALDGLAASLATLYLSTGLLLAAPLAIVHTGWIVAVQEAFPGARLLMVPLGARGWRPQSWRLPSTHS